MTKSPVLKCIPVGNDQVKVWCPFCNTWHFHHHTGKIKAGDIGHHMAPCHDENSPFSACGGYQLKIMTKSEIREIAASLEYYTR